MTTYSINKTRALSLGCFTVLYAAVLLVFNWTDYNPKGGGVLSNFLGVLLGSFFAGALWVSLQRNPLSDSEKIQLTAGCIFSAVALELIRVSVLTSVTHALQLFFVLLLSHVAVGGFVVLGGLHLGQWVVQRKNSLLGEQ